MNVQLKTSHSRIYVVTQSHACPVPNSIHLHELLYKLAITKPWRFTHFHYQSYLYVVIHHRKEGRNKELKQEQELAFIPFHGLYEGCLLVSNPLTLACLPVLPAIVFPQPDVLLYIAKIRSFPQLVYASSLQKYLVAKFCVFVVLFYFDEQSHGFICVLPHSVHV